MKLLEVENLKKSFEDVDVLHDISLSVEEGEVVAIIGPSGSGKSTLLRCCTGLEEKDSGNIRYEGHFGLVFQNFNLFPHYSVLKNVMDAPIHVQKRDKKEVEKEARELLEKMGLSDKAKAYPCQLSGGQQQRVAIARALALKPSILFFDDPTSALDPELTGEILKVIKELENSHSILLLYSLLKQMLIYMLQVELILGVLVVLDMQDNLLQLLKMELLLFILLNLMIHLKR